MMRWLRRLVQLEFLPWAGTIRYVRGHRKETIFCLVLCWGSVAAAFLLRVLGIYPEPLLPAVLLGMALFLTVLYVASRSRITGCC